MIRLKSAWREFRAWTHRISWVRRRIIAIFGTLAIGWAATTLYAFFNWPILGGPFSDEMKRSIFSAWTGELSFFTLIGLVVTIITLRDPAEEDFENRLKILYGGKPVPDNILHYNKNQISKLAGYVTQGKRTIYIERYSKEHEAYLAKIKTEYTIRNLLPDADYKDALRIRIRPDAFKDIAPDEIGRVTSIQVGKTENITRGAAIISKDGFSTEVPIEIAKGSTEFVTFEYSLWLVVGELQGHRPQRAIDQISMDIVSQCDNTPRVEIEGDSRGPVSLIFNQRVPFAPVQGVSPGERIFVFRLLAPDGNPI